MNPKVLVRIYDTKNHHLEDFKLPKSEAIYLAPGGYLSDYQWAKGLTLPGKNARKIQSVGHDTSVNKGPSTDKENTPWISIWVD